MNLFKAIIASLLFSLIPSWTNAQRRFEISAGISTPGYHTWERGGGLFVDQYNLAERYEYNKLSNMDRYSYRSSYNPGYSIQAVYKLPDHGFTKRLSILSYAGLNTVDFEKYDYLTNKSLYRETAVKLDVLAGVRFQMVSRPRFMMYTQTLVGFHFNDESLYWDYNSYLETNPATVQITFLGLRFQSAQGRFCFLTELGTGSEYELGGLVLIPGVRLGLGYTF